MDKEPEAGDEFVVEDAKPQRISGKFGSNRVVVTGEPGARFITISHPTRDPKFSDMVMIARSVDGTVMWGAAIPPSHERLPPHTVYVMEINRPE